MNILKNFNNNTMNLFKKIYTAISDATKELNQELRIKASYKTCLAQLEESLIKREQAFENKLKSENITFDSIKNSYIDIAETKEEIKLVKEAYEYIFSETTEKKK